MLLLGLAVGLAFACSAQAAPPLHGPPGTSYAKTLVIGTDGTRWDLVQRVIAAGRAPNLSRLGKRGIAGPTRLPYSPPAALTLSEVGWSTIATGVGPAKHHVNGFSLNNDPDQFEKAGWPDFLTRAERLRPRLSTFLASDWANIGRHEHGGPIFGDRMDTSYALAAADTIASYAHDDQLVTNAAASYLRNRNPDLGFVYLGVVDETAHAVGSATAQYTAEIARTDRRIGELLTAIRSRPSYGRERWTVIVTTDHGQRNLTSGSLLSHGSGSDLEETSFVIAAGPGIRDQLRTSSPGIVDVAPTALRGVGIAPSAAWNIDGSSFVRGVVPPAPPTPRVTLRVRRGRLALKVTATAAAGAPRIARFRLTLPRGIKLRRRAAVRLRATGRPIGKLTLRANKWLIRVRVGGAGAGRVSLSTRRGAVTISRKLLRRLRGHGARLALHPILTEAGHEPAAQLIYAKIRRR